MAYASPSTVNSGDDITVAYANTSIKGNLDELESRKDTNLTQFTSNVTVSATVEASSTTIVTASGAITANGTDYYEVEFFCPDFTLGSNASGNACTFVLFDSGTQGGRMGYVANGASTTTLDVPVDLRWRFQPTNGSHTYSIRGFRTNADCTVKAGSGASGALVPGHIRVRKVQ